MIKDDKIFLAHIADAINQIEQYTAELDESGFRDSRLVQDAVIRQFEIIGEASKNVSSALRSQHPKVPWSDLAGFRDKLIHHYFGVDIVSVWLSVSTDMPILKQQITSIIINQ